MKKAALFILAIWLTSTLSVYSQTTGNKGITNIYIKPETGEQIKIFNKSYALIIANYNYTNGWAPLLKIKNECRQLSDSLYRHGFDQVILRENRTRDQMMDDIDLFIQMYGYNANDRVLIYYSGHGNVTMEGEYDQGFVVPVDAPYFKADADMEKLNDYRQEKGKYKSNQNAFEKKSIGYNRWISYAHEIKARHSLFLFDCCFSGQLLTNRNDDLPIEISIAVLNCAVEFLTAGNKVQSVPAESEFLKYFLMAISGKDPSADINGDGYLKTSELFDYLSAKVKHATGKDPQKCRLPGAKYELGEFVFILPWAGKNKPMPDIRPPSYKKPVDNQVLTYYYGEKRNLLPDSTNARYYSKVIKMPNGYSVTNYYINNKVQCTGTYSKIKNIEGEDIQNGEFIWYRENGNIELKSTYLNGELNGDQVQYFDNGNIKQQTQYISGQQNGKDILYFENGKTAYIANVKNNKYEGKLVKCFENGDINLICFFDNDTICGDFKWYEKNGDRLIFNVDKFGNGTFETHQNGINIEGELKKGKAQGRVHAWNKDQSIYRNFENGSDGTTTIDISTIIQEAEIKSRLGF